MLDDILSNHYLSLDIFHCKLLGHWLISLVFEMLTEVSDRIFKMSFLVYNIVIFFNLLFLLVTFRHLQSIVSFYQLVLDLTYNLIISILSKCYVFYGFVCCIYSFYYYLELSQSQAFIN